MIHTCEICGNDFLTEADCFVVRPTPKGNKLYCYCQIKGFEEMRIMEKLKTENDELRQAKERFNIAIVACIAEMVESGVPANAYNKAMKELEKR